MSDSPKTNPKETAKFFADLRRHNEYSRRVARMLAAKRARHIERVVEVQRKQRLHQAR